MRSTIYKAIGILALTAVMRFTLIHVHRWDNTNIVTIFITNRHGTEMIIKGVKINPNAQPRPNKD